MTERAKVLTYPHTDERLGGNVVYNPSLLIAVCSGNEASCRWCVRSVDRGDVEVPNVATSKPYANRRSPVTYGENRVQSSPSIGMKLVARR